MKAVILAGGLPSTVIEEDEKIPKPMAEIGTQPILWHIMKQYAHFGIKDFVICGGYKVEMIKDYFRNFYIYHSDITIDLGTNEVTIHKQITEDWKVTVVDTGLHSTITERLMKIKEYIEGEDYFAVAYGDCVSNIDLSKMVEQHCSGNHIMTLAVAKPVGRNRILPIVNGMFDDDRRGEMIAENAWVNACSMLFYKEVFRYLEESESIDSLIECLREKKLVTPFFHNGFWSPMETVRDRDVLDNLWKMNKAPWKVWEEEEN